MSNISVSENEASSSEPENKNSPAVIEESPELQRASSSTVPPDVPSDEPPDAPDGGWPAWSQVVSAHIANMISWGYGTGFSVFQLYYKQTMNLPAVQVSWIGSVQIFLCFLVGVASGRLSDGGHSRQLYATGAIICIFGMFMTSLTNTYWQILLAQGFCQGIGAGLVFMPASASVAVYFKKNRSFAIAASGCGSSSGAILYPAIVQFLMPSVGFPWAVRICGFISIALAIVGFCLLKPRELHRVPAPYLDLKAFKSLPYSLFTAGSFLVYFSLFTILIYINSFAREILGLGDVKSVEFVLVTNAIAIVARPIFGFLADKFLGPVETFGLNCIALGVMAFGWIGVHERIAMYVYSAFVGFVNGGAQGLFTSAISSFVPDVRKMGTWIGMTLGLCGFATLAGPPTMGAIVDANGGKYLWAQIWAGSTIIIGGTMVLISSRLVLRNSAKPSAI
ncbi:MFS general substrate transporter [Daldinia eschscholtzii]|nr:MFS general substrate transporter [Daldinia eschscholtzii]